MKLSAAEYFAYITPRKDRAQLPGAEENHTHAVSSITAEQSNMILLQYGNLETIQAMYRLNSSLETRGLALDEAEQMPVCACVPAKAGVEKQRFTSVRV
jgi:hypothetical protein